MKTQDFLTIIGRMEHDLGGSGYFIKVTLRNGVSLHGTYALPFGSRSYPGPIAILDYAPNDPPAIYLDIEEIVTLSGPYTEASDVA